MLPEYRAKVSLKNPYHFLGLGFGSGLIPFMPGTFGSLAAIPLLYLMSDLSDILFIIITLLSFGLGIIICQKTTDALELHDHGAIVWDEIAGMFVTFIFVPVTWQTLIIGFVLFRIFDILKPFPIRYFDKKVHGGFGIMFDDILAGIIACGLLHAILFYFGDYLI